MKKISLCFAIVFLMVLTACREERPDMSGLLKTVPSSAAAVVGIHLKDIAEDAGCKIKDNQIVPGKEVKQMLDNLSESDRSELLSLLGGDTGIEPECAVLFLDANRFFLTVSLYDVARFKEFVKQDKGVDFSEAGNGVWLCKNVAVKGNQAWICLSTAKQIDADGIAAYASLAQSQSFLNTDMAKVILEGDDDVAGWGNFNVVMSRILSRSDMSKLVMASGFLFDDVEAFSFTLDFDKGEMEASAEFLNSKGKPAKFLLPADKINPKAITDLGGSCDALTAFMVTPKLLQKIEKLGTAMGGSLFGNLKESFKNIDGTVVIAQGNGPEAISGLITTNGKVSGNFTDMISFFGVNLEQDGNYLRFSKGNLTGGLQTDECASILKGYSIGAVVDLQKMQELSGNYGTNLPSSLRLGVIGFEPNGSGLRLIIELKTADEKENFLLSFIKAL